MKNFLIPVFLLIASVFSACVTPVPVTSSVNGSTPGNEGNARNWVMIMHGESCGNANEVASNMYVENNHETSSVTTIVDISWTENGTPMHENKTISVLPDSKTLIGCDHRNGVYLKMEIVNAVFR